MKIQGLDPWMRGLPVAVAGIVMVSLFVLAGGLGSGRSAVVLAGSAGASSTANPGIVGISLNSCAGTGLSGSVAVADKFTGNLILGLFALEPSPQHLTRQFVDTRQRATAAYSHALLAPFSFTVPAVKAPAYEVVVLPSTGKITATTILVESQAIPLCNTQTVTATATDTQTATTTSTSTATNYVTSLEPIISTVTVPAGGGSTVMTTVTGTTTTTSTVDVTTTYFSTVTFTIVV
ncbi:MAG: hypothetical protein ACRDIE_22910 [Chloroflexota bacterium]